MSFLFGTGGNSVLIYPHKNQYAPGETIEGTALVSIVKQTDFTGLFIKVSGKEKLQFADTETHYVPYTETYTVNGRTQTRSGIRAVQVPVTRYGTHVLFKIELLALAGGLMLPGQYSVPFRFALPLGLPGSFKLVESGFSCGITYEVKAIVRVPGLFKSNLRSVHEFDVPQTPPTFTRAFTASADSDINVCCCINRGRAQLTFRCTRDSFMPGEDVGIVTSVSNRSSAELKRITIKLRRYIHLRADTGHIRSFEYTVSERVYPGLAKMTEVKDVPMTLSIPHDAPQQCYGAKIRCLYTARLSGKVRCGSDATCSVPVFLYKAQITTGFAVPTYPDNWNPVILEQVNFSNQATQFNVPPPVKLSEYPEWDRMVPSAPETEQDAVLFGKQAVDGVSTSVIRQSH